MYAIALALWAAFLVAAIYFTRRERHPRMLLIGAELAPVN